MGKQIHEILREKRKEKGLSVIEVSDRLKENGIEIAPKTIYNWETGHSDPMSEVFLLLCQIYDVGDILDEFGYGSVDANFYFTATEREKIIRYRTLDDHGKGTVDMILNNEYKRCQAAQPAVPQGLPQKYASAQVAARGSSDIPVKITEEKAAAFHAEMDKRKDDILKKMRESGL